ncbi:hypothetical protein DFS34DRAFT_622755 [Phlyctochytrium arcticum]|nr:hypothetical protein DFS34DRAFT_622755 [Phlyctochytrium arcticum]
MRKYTVPPQKIPQSLSPPPRLVFVLFNGFLLLLCQSLVFLFSVTDSWRVTDCAVTPSDTAPRAQHEKTSISTREKTSGFSGLSLVTEVFAGLSAAISRLADRPQLRNRVQHFKIRIQTMARRTS